MFITLVVAMLMVFLGTTFLQPLLSPREHPGLVRVLLGDLCLVHPHGSSSRAVRFVNPAGARPCRAENFAQKTRSASEPDTKRVRKWKQTKPVSSLRLPRNQANPAAGNFPSHRHAYRTEFQRDRARIIHSRAFRRLEYKTQVFLNGTGDHLRTRLTHTIEVASISRTIARALRLNEDLAEAIALAHDLGHSPFGHSGEEMLAECMREHGGFEHNRQSLRVVELLEHPYPKFPGLNLTSEVREGLKKTR